VLTLVEAWMDAAQITGGAVFRGFYKGGQSVRSTPLTTRAVQMILASYPIDIDGRRAAVQPHDCRRTYARRLYEAGVDPVRIQQNLGHADLQTTLGYIGTLDVAQRRPPEIYPAFDLSKLGR
jgi:integrase